MTFSAGRRTTRGRHTRASVVLTLPIALLWSVQTSAVSAPVHYTAPVDLFGTDPVGAALADGRSAAAGEPSLVVSRNGVVYVTGEDTVGRPALMWSSHDGGRTFFELSSPAQARERSTGAEGDLALDTQQRIYLVDTTGDDLLLTRWSHSGGVWDFTRPVAVGVTPDVNDRPWLRSDADTLWLAVNHSLYATIARSRDAGQTWQQVFQSPVNVGAYYPGNFALDTHARSPRHGTAYLVGPNGDHCPGDAPLCSVAVSPGGGTSYGAVAPVGRAAVVIIPSIATDDAGNVYVAFTAGDAHGCGVYLTYSRDGARHWSSPRRVDDGHGCSVYPAIAAGNEGRLAIAYYQEREVESSMESTGPRARWFVHVTYLTHTDTPHPDSLDSVADPGPVHAGPLDNKQLRDFFTVTVGPDGRAWLAYTQDSHVGPDGPVGTGVSNAESGLATKGVRFTHETAGPQLR